MTVGRADDAAHDPGPGDWQEHWHVELVTDAGLALYARLTVWPSARVAWWWTAVLLPGAPGPVLVRASDLALPRAPGFAVRGEGVWAELVCETPLEHWSVGLEAFGVRLDDSLDALRDERGERVAVGLDVEWERLGDPYALPGVSTTDGYAQAGTLHGELLVGRDTITLDAPALRLHEWGDSQWWSAEGYRAASPELLPGSVVTDRHDAAVAVEPGPSAPVLLEAPDGRRGALTRAPCRIADRDGASPVAGWAEWRQSVQGSS